MAEAVNELGMFLESKYKFASGKVSEMLISR